MFIKILLANTLHNVLLTLGIVIVLVGIFLISHLLNLKYSKKGRAIILGISYFISFIALVGSTAFLLWTWNFPLDQYFTNLGTNLSSVLADSIGLMVSTALVIFIALFILKVAKLSMSRIGSKPSTSQKRKKTIAKLLQSVLKYGIWLVTILIVLSIWGVNVGPALAGLGIAGLVIGLGAQKFINDLINGLFIIFEQHFDVGDVIETNGFRGEVTDIGLKTTKIKNWKGEVKILANGEITDVLNCSRNASIAIVDFGVAYGENIQEVIDLLTVKLPDFRKLFPDIIIEDPQCLGVIELAGSSVNIRAIAKTLNNQHYAIERSLRTFIKRTLDENGIEIPFPQVVVHEAK